MMKVSPLSSVTLYIPELWDKPWEEYVEEAEGLEREFLRAQAAYARVLRRIHAVPATPEKIAFLSLWSRLFGSLTGARGAASWQSRFAVSALGRVAFEASLHLQAVALPILEAKDGSANDHQSAAWLAVEDRLCGYLAWTLRSDQLMYEKFLSRGILEEAFDPEPERDFIDDLGSAKGAWERLTHQQLEVVSDQEAAFDLERAKERHIHRSARIGEWLTDERLAPWHRRLLSLESDKKQRGSVSLFQVFDLPASVASFLRRRQTSLGYLTYARGSGFIHGSSLEASMLVSDSLLSPDFANLASGFEDAAQGILSGCGIARILLDLLGSHLETVPPAV